MGVIIGIFILIAIIYGTYTVIKWIIEDKEYKEQIKISGECKQEIDKDMNRFMEQLKSENILNTDMTLNLKCPIKKYLLSNKTEYTFNDKIQIIQCYIGLIEDYLYIVPKNLKENEWNFSSDNYCFYNIVNDYKRLEPNYKGLFFKINVNDIKFYKTKGMAYASTSGNIKSDYSYGTFFLTGDSEYKTTGNINTKVKDNREIEFYYNEEGRIKQLLFDYEALTSLQLLIPDKEKK